MLELISAGGWLMLVIIACSVVAIAICIERFFVLNSRRIAPAHLLPTVWKQVQAGEFDAAKLRKLRETPALFEAMIENGRKRREAYTVTQRAAAWVDVINTRAGPLFDQWQRKSPITRRLVWSSMMVTEPMSKRYYRHYIGRGQRILDMET